MEHGKEHAELMTRLAVFEATVNGKFDSIISHLSNLNGQVAKNTGAVTQLQLDDKDIRSLLFSHIRDENTKEDADNKRIDAREKKAASWKERWIDLFFGTLKYFLPIFLSLGVLSLLSRGTQILNFFDNL